MTAVNRNCLNIELMFLGQLRCRLTRESEMSVVCSIVDADWTFKTRGVNSGRPKLEFHRVFVIKWHLSADGHCVSGVSNRIGRTREGCGGAEVAVRHCREHCQRSTGTMPGHIQVMSIHVGLLAKVSGGVHSIIHLVIKHGEVAGLSLFCA